MKQYDAVVHKSEFTKDLQLFDENDIKVKTSIFPLLVNILKKEWEDGGFLYIFVLDRGGVWRYD